MLNQSQVPNIRDFAVGTQVRKRVNLQDFSQQGAMPSEFKSKETLSELDMAPSPRLYEVLTDNDIANLRRSIVQRQQRYEHFGNELFFDPAWDIILTLAYAEVEQRRVSTTELCAASAVPVTTALRWISNMTTQGALTRRPDPFDRRRVYVELSEATSKSVSQYIHSIRKSY